MKKLLLLFAGILCFGFTQAKQIPIDQAKQVAANWISTKTLAKCPTDLFQLVETKSNNNQNSYYVFEMQSGGWIIVAADDIAYPVIGYSLDSKTDPENKPLGYIAWMNAVNGAIESAIAENPEPDQKITEAWKRFNVDCSTFEISNTQAKAVAPLLTTTWNQGTGYNAYCPEDASGPDGHTYAGCVAAAMSQVMNYHEYPTTGYGSHTYNHATYGNLSADFGSTTYNWASMPDATYSSDIALLMYHCGVAVEMNYGPDGSGANTSTDATNALKNYFKYSMAANYKERASYTDPEWIALVMDEIDNSRPMVYRGTGAQGGHAFVCDGYDDSDNLHFNWGWSGSYNGYYAVTSLTPGSYDFTTDQGAIMNIEPLTSIEALTFPYNQGYESGITSEWITSGDRVLVSTSEYQEGSQSLQLGTTDGVNYNVATAAMYIEVPDNAHLSFWVKRGYDPYPSAYNDHYAYILDTYGDTANNLYKFFYGDYNDTEWQEYTLDMAAYAGQTVRLYFEQYNSSNSYNQWMNIDNVTIETYIEWTGTTSTDWNTASNWAGNTVPTSVDNVRIPSAPSNQPVLNSASMACNLLTIESGASLTIGVDGELTASGGIANEGTLTLLSDGTGTGSLISEDVHTGAGTTDIQLYLAENATTANWHYVGIPVESTTSDAFTPPYNHEGTDYYALSWNEANDQYDPITSSGYTMDVVGKGYAIPSASARTLHFDGTLNTATTTWSGLTYTGTTTLPGFNLLGNPYTAAIDLLSANTTMTNLYLKVWYPTGGGNFAVYDIDNTMGINGGTQYVPAMQGFWVCVQSGMTGSMEVTTDALNHQGTSVYKSTKDNILRLELSGNNLSDETAIVFRSEALKSYDVFDTRKMFATNDQYPQIYTETDDNSLVINALPAIEESIIVPLEVKLKNSGTFTITSTNINDFSTFDNVYLEDTYTGRVVDLNEQSSYTFESDVVNSTGRFNVLFGKQTATGIQNSDNTVQIYAYRNNICIRTNQGINGTMTLYNSLGKVLIKENINTGGGLYKRTINQPTGIYMISLESKNKLYTKKVIIR